MLNLVENYLEILMNISQITTVFIERKFLNISLYIYEFNNQNIIYRKMVYMIEEMYKLCQDSVSIICALYVANTVCNYNWRDKIWLKPFSAK